MFVHALGFYPFLGGYAHPCLAPLALKVGGFMLVAMGGC